MLLDFGVGYVFCFFRKAEHNILKKVSWPKFCNIFWFLWFLGPCTNKLTWSHLIKCQKKCVML